MLPDVWRGERGAWNPIREINRLQRSIDRIFNDFLTEPFTGGLGRELLPMGEEMGFTPACDVEETESHYLVSFDLPGMKKDEVRIELQDHQLVVSGERKQESKKEAQGRVSRERYYGAFRRSFMLPSDIKADQVEARYENGVLQISIPKGAVAAGKQIPIKEGKAIEAKGTKAA
jgi:HSP20 family protein